MAAMGLGIRCCCSHAFEADKFSLNMALRRGARDETGPVYIVIGDGGNREGLSETYNDPQPEWSAFRCGRQRQGAAFAAKEVCINSPLLASLFLSFLSRRPFAPLPLH